MAVMFDLGLTTYRNVSSVNPEIKMQFVHETTVSCEYRHVNFVQNKQKFITIKVSHCQCR